MDPELAAIAGGKKRNRKEQALKEAEQRLNLVIDQDLLEIAYYPPGYITPEEFCHRLLLSIHRLKPADEHVTLLFNSLDQLSYRFPLCAKESIFIPGIISMLTAERISSFFVSVEESDPAKSYGLDTMAELILVFTRENLSWEKYTRSVTNAIGRKLSPPTMETSEWKVVKVSVGRYAGGQAAGAEGYLELLDDNHWLRNDCKERDLYFLPSMPAEEDGGESHG